MRLPAPGGLPPARIVVRHTVALAPCPFEQPTWFDGKPSREGSPMAGAAGCRESFVLTHDLGTSGNKACLYRVSDRIEQVSSYLVEYPLFLTPDGGAEQRVEDWWQAVCESTKALLERTKIDPASVKGMAFCSQLQGSILIDKDGQALRNPMIWLDGRAQAQVARYLYNGIIRIEKWNAFKTLRSLQLTNGLPATPKDPIWKYHWVKDNEPEIFARAWKWVDVKDYLTLRCTGKLGMTFDSAQLTWVYDTRPGRFGWSKALCRLYGVNMDHLPPVVRSVDVIGPLAATAARQMGLAPGTPVFGGGGDASMITIGAGCTKDNDTHIYIGTSGWVAATVARRSVDIGNFMAAVLGAIPGRYVYMAEQETAGVCLQWVRDHLALDEIGLYLGAQHIVDADKNEEWVSLYDFLNQAVSQTEPGAGGVIFTPWMHGNRSPREDAFARGMFFNLGLETGKRQMIRAVLEGVAYHMRWMLEALAKHVPQGRPLRLAGGGAKSAVWAQIMADVTGRPMEVVESAQDAGTAGAAIVCGVGLGLVPSFEEAGALVRVARTYEPNPANKAVYERQYAVFTELYRQNRKLFRQLNDREAQGGTK